MNKLINVKDGRKRFLFQVKINRSNLPFLG